MTKGRLEVVDPVMSRDWYPEAASARQTWGLKARRKFWTRSCHRAHEGPVEEHLSMSVLDSDVHSLGLAEQPGCDLIREDEVHPGTEHPGCAHWMDDLAPWAARRLSPTAGAALLHIRFCENSGLRECGHRRERSKNTSHLSLDLLRAMKPDLVRCP
jgi:hypothetical protein